MRRPKVFVSFTKRGAEGQYIWQLLDRLEKQPLRVWVYERAESEIPAGLEIGDELTRRIDDSNVFLPVITAAAFDSTYTRFEVDYALSRRALGKDLRIIPFVSRCIVQNLSDPWPKVYRELSTLRYRTVDFGCRVSVEAAVLDFCADLRVEYQPSVTEHPRMPFLDRFVAEIRQSCPRRDDREIGIYIRLMDIFNQFALAMNREDYSQAHRLMSFFCATCEYEFAGATLYYAAVTLGVCLLLLGRLDEAARRFESLLSHPLVDECTYGGLGFINQQRRQFAVAREWYRRASERCPSDPAARVGVVLNSIMCACPVDIDAAFQGVDIDEIPTDERYGFQAIRAISLLAAGRMNDARELFEPLVEANLADVGAVVLFANQLEHQGRRDLALALLERVHTITDDADVAYEIAVSRVLQGERDRALILLKELIERHPQVRQYRIDAAQILWCRGYVEDARRICEPLLEPNVVPLPQSGNDFYLDGFANWFLGNFECAEYDFRRSGLPAESHYRNLVCQHPSHE